MEEDKAERRESLERIRSVRGSKTKKGSWRSTAISNVIDTCMDGKVVPPIPDRRREYQFADTSFHLPQTGRNLRLASKCYYVDRSIVPSRSAYRPRWNLRCSVAALALFRSGVCRPILYFVFLLYFHTASPRYVSNVFAISGHVSAC